MRHTVTVEDTTFVVEHIRAWRLEPSYTSTEGGGWLTRVWVSDLMGAFSVYGDHVETLRAAVEDALRDTAEDST